MREELHKRGIEEIEKHLTLLEQQRLENHKLWDTQILALSSLILGLSLTVLNDFIDINLANYNCLLKLSWLLLWGTVVSTIVNFYIAEKSQVKWKEILIKQAKHSLDLYYSSNKLDGKLKELEISGNLAEFKKQREGGINQLESKIKEHDLSLSPMNISHEKWNSVIEWFNIIKTLCFVLALSLLIIYVNFNL